MADTFWSTYMEERKRALGFRTHEEMATYLGEPRANVTKWFNGSWPREEGKFEAIVGKLGGNPFAGMILRDDKAAPSPEVEALRQRNKELEAELSEMRKTMESIQKLIAPREPAAEVRRQ